MRIPIWAIPPLILTLGTAVCAVLEAAILDAFVRRPQQGGGSITTLLPGLVYASATVMKVGLVGGLVATVAGLVWRNHQSTAATPRWGITSIGLTPSALLFGSLAVLAAQNLIGQQDGLSDGHFSQVSRTAVFVMLAVLLTGIAVAWISLVRREGSRMAAVLGLAANLILAGLFWYFRFYALGFDQDQWAPR